MREQAEDLDRIIENWIETFDLQQDDGGVWRFDPNQTALWEAHQALRNEHEKLIRKWNKTVATFNAAIDPRDPGRPLAASSAQQAGVRKRRKAGESLRAIAKATGLSLRTVRTITEKAAGTGRAGQRRNQYRRKELDRIRAAAFRARKKERDALPKRIAEVQQAGAALIKAAKGLGKR